MPSLQDKNVRVLVLGHARHGKDTFAELLCQHYGLTMISSSRAVLKELWPAINACLPGKYTDVEQAFEDRGNHRPLWKALISLYNSADKTAMVRLILSKANIYVGLRDVHEYMAGAHLFDYIFWVDASSRLPLEPTMDLNYDGWEMRYIDNNGSLEDLKKQVASLKD